MNPRKVNRILWTLAATMVVAAAGVCAYAWLVPVEVEVAAAAKQRAASAPSSQPAALPPLAAFEPVWTLDLRKPLTVSATAPASQPVSVNSAPSSAGPLTLVGTIGQSLAMVQLTGGPVEVRGVGEMIGSIRILAIRPAQVDIEMAGQRITLHKPQRPATAP